MDHASLVQQIKQLERTEPGANRLWEKYADEHGGGSRDPAFHDATFLQGFLDSYSSGSLQQAQGAPDPEHSRLIEQIKDWERTSWEAQQKWISYCDRNGGGTRDPALHHVAFLKAFIDNYDSIKTGWGAGATAPSDDEHANLIEQVKQLERTDQSANQKWASYCDTHGGGSRDPARHDKLFLQAFLKLQSQVADHRELKAAMAGTEPAAIAQEMAGSAGGGIASGQQPSASASKPPRPTRPMQTPHPAEAAQQKVVPADPDHASLVEQVKQLERADPGANQQWECYADAHGGSRDPAFHDAAFLKGFLDSYKSGSLPKPHMVSDPEHAKLVEEIKDWERTSWEAQQKWISYCDRNGGGKRDPALHSVAFLQGFKDQYDSIVTGWGPGATAPMDDEHASLIEQVKQLERTDPSANQKWASYCDTYGGGSRDPARHDKLFLQAFLKLQGQVADHRELKAALAGTEPAEIVQEKSIVGGA